ncbi:hypothetical protein FHS34_002261 [Streptomyces echinatus]|uniref:Uncharacterized protein n=1 Tax=Streptomyces echinatus TaxID=67293 RepID=A0A7W9UPX1_9ACTN|nr:hypothetical protein [Streptomyces echinatus]
MLQKTIGYRLPATVNATTIASDIKGSFGPDAWHGVT